MLRKEKKGSLCKVSPSYICVSATLAFYSNIFLLRIRTVVRRAFQIVGFSIETIQSRRTLLRHVLHDVPETVRG